MYVVSRGTYDAFELLTPDYNRSGSSWKIAIKIIVQMRDGSVYLPAAQEVPYLNRNTTVLSQFCAIESLYDCYHVALF